MATKQHPAYTLIGNIKTVVNGKHKALKKISAILFLICGGDQSKYERIINILNEQSNGNIPESDLR